jgi:plastocyanin
MRCTHPGIPLAASLVAVATLVFAAASARADDTLDMSISIKDHKFEPETLKVPAGKPIKLTVNNLDDTAEEFESYPLRFEKVVAGKQSAIVRIKPLEAGTYIFFGEYHSDTAHGTVVAE